MPIRQQLWLGLGLAAIVSGLLLMALGRVTVAPRTDRAAVMALLDQRGIAYREVAVRAGAGGVPQDGNAYVAAVEVAAEPTGVRDDRVRGAPGLRFEPRGCGRSTWDGHYDLDTLLADAETIRAAYAVDRWIVAGHSAGVDVALAYALRYPAPT